MKRDMSNETKIIETGVTKIVKAEQFSGRRRAKEGESEYVKELLLEHITGAPAKGFLLWMALLMILLSPTGAFNLITALVTDTGMLDLTNIVVSGVALLLLCLTFCGGVAMLKGFIRDLKADKRFRADILNGRFYVIDVSVVAYHHNSDPESCESLVTIQDCEQNEADTTYLTVNWQGIKGNDDKGIIVLMESVEGDLSMFGRVFPCYDGNDAYCKKLIAKFRKRKIMLN